MFISLNTIDGSGVNSLPVIPQELSETNVESQKHFEHAEACDKSENYSTASEGYQKAAELGHVEAMVKLGDYFMKGRGMWRDQEAAAKWYKKAAELGNPSAMTKYGVCCEKRECFGSRIAFFWYQKAADNNDPEGLYRLAMAYKTGLGTPRGSDDGVEALLERAVQLQYPAAFGELGSICCLSSLWVRPGYEDGALQMKKAVDLYKKGVALGDVMSMKSLAFSYRIGGGGLEKSVDKYFEFIHMAARCNDLEAICMLGDCYKKGEGVKRNFEKAVEMWKRGVSLGDALSAQKLAECFRWGDEVPQDLRCAVEFYHKAIQLGSKKSVCVLNPTVADALEGLGQMYLEGVGVQKDSREAVRLLRQASLLGSLPAQISLQEICRKE